MDYFKKQKKWIHALGVLICFAVGYMIRSAGPFRLGQMPVAYIFFVIGYYGKSVPVKLTRLKHKWFWLIVSVMLFLEACKLNGFSEMAVRNYGRNYLLYFCVGTLATISIVLFSMLLGENRILEYYGQNSLIVMCSHFYFSNYLIPLMLDTLGIAAILENPIYEVMLALLLCAVLVPLICLINKCPLLCGKAQLEYLFIKDKECKKKNR